ncbi:phosphodiesterase [Pontibaca salina]|uniref:Phosphodiesterase n=1 Tax=Pontibaca salina TaxID=2795731 RepID=A0A934M0X7_9RHOB|nr:phosphodiesterase [Pontibaca salina]MBI6630460.1 phosphodiesterase [Pontibaca salina]
MKFIHLTDLHISADGSSPALKMANEHTRRAIDEINRLHADAELCIITGDIVADPDPDAYRLAEELISSLTMPVYALPGNHDDREMACQALSCVRADENGFLQQVVETSHGPFLLLDTIAPGSHAGVMCQERLNWVAETLQSYAEPVRLFMHHAPFPTGLAAMDTIGLDPAAAERLGDILVAHGYVTHLFFGHYHRPMSGVWRGIPFSSHRSMMQQCALDLFQADHVPAIFEEPQFAVVLVSDAQTVVHYHDFASTAQRGSMGTATG